MRIGVNYVPSTGWWYSWVDWNAAALARDLDAVAELGADHLRIHCLWPLFQPNATSVSPLMLERTRELMHLASARGLDVCVSVLDGWLSGFDFRPAWLGDTGNMFTDPEAVDAQMLLISSLADVLNTEAAFIGFDIGNEVNVLSRPDRNPTAGRAGGAWAERLLQHCALVAPGRQHTNGVDHNPWLTDGTSFDRPTLANTGDLVSVHAWSYFTGALDRYGENSTGVSHLSEFMLELAKAYRAPGTHRLVWLQEVGVAHQWLASSTVEEFTWRTVEASASVDELWGITWWCSHDIDRKLTGFADLEYDLGLLTVGNQIKPMGKAFQSVTREVRNMSPVSRTHGLVLPAAATPDLAFADEFFAMVDAGVRPAIVLEQHAADSAYLESRGLTTLRQADRSTAKL